MAINTIEGLIEQVKENFPQFDSTKIRHAYDVAAKAHAHQKRKSGEPYVYHCLETAYILSDLRMDPPTIMAGLLHDTVEDTDLTLKEVARDFGEVVAKLVDGVTRLGQIAEETGTRKGNLQHIEVESLRKMFLAMSEDVRVVLIKLSDRLHNMRTLHALPRHKQINIARETRELFSPLANRLGMWQIKWELEDLCLRYLEPEIYLSLVEQLNERREERDALVNEVSDSLYQALKDQGIDAEISGRAKHLYSIYKKMKRKDRDLDQIFDVRAVRVVVNSKAECYATLGIVHSLWRPIPQEFDDYIANPKENNYQSLHTAVYVPGGKTLEVQIRTHEMHQYAEYGVAAHWRYKESGKQDRYLDHQVRFLRQMLDWRNEDGEDGEDGEDAETFMDKVRSEVLPDRVFVFTPKGKIIELPAGATPIDFAYYIHTEVGHRCRGAKIHGKIVPLDYQLQYADRVEILTVKRGGPSRDWLNPYLGYVKTSRVKSKIRSWFRKQDREENVRQGREMMERELRKLALRVPLDELAQKNRFDKLDDFLAQIGAGDLSPHSIAVKELEARQAEEKFQGIEAEIAAYQQDKAPPKKPDRLDSGVKVRGVGTLMNQIAGCCKPVPGEKIMGYVTRGHGISVHKRTCPNILNKYDSERLVELEWGTEPSSRFPVTLKILALDREGLLRDIVDVVSNEKINMSSVHALTDKSDNSAIVTATLEVADVNQLSRILSRLNGLRNVVEAHRATN